MNLRFVLDANIFVSALIKPDGVPGTILKRILNSADYSLILTEDITSELKRILKYPKIKKNVYYTDEELDLWVSCLEVLSHIVKPRFTYANLVLYDPDDDCYLIAALEGKAKYLISGDKHLLKLNPYKNIKIITAAECLKLLDK